MPSVSIPRGSTETKGRTQVFITLELEQEIDSQHLHKSQQSATCHNTVGVGFPPDLVLKYIWPFKATKQADGGPITTSQKYAISFSCSGGGGRRENTLQLAMTLGPLLLSQTLTHQENFRE